MHVVVAIVNKDLFLSSTSPAQIIEVLISPKSDIFQIFSLNYPEQFHNYCQNRPLRAWQLFGGYLLNSVQR